MGQLSYYVENTSYSWRTTAYLNYTVDYNAETNQSTVTFTGFETTYWGTSGYYTTITDNITVSAVDNTSSSGTASLTISSTTNGGSKTFTGVPSPASITVQHTATGAGVKQVKIEGTTRIYAAMSGSTQAYANGSGFATETVTTLYTFNKTVSAGVIASVKNGDVELSDGALVKAGDVLQMWRSAAAGYELTQATFTGADEIVADGATYTVSGNVNVIITAKAQAIVHISNGTSWDNYSIYISDGTGWDMYQVYISNGSAWEPYA